MSFILRNEINFSGHVLFGKDFIVISDFGKIIKYDLYLNFLQETDYYNCNILGKNFIATKGNKRFLLDNNFNLIKEIPENLKIAGSHNKKYVFFYNEGDIFSCYDTDMNLISEKNIEYGEYLSYDDKLTIIKGNKIEFYDENLNLIKTIITGFEHSVYVFKQFKNNYFVVDYGGVLKIFDTNLNLIKENLIFKLSDFILYKDKEKIYSVEGDEIIELYNKEDFLDYEGKEIESLRDYVFKFGNLIYMHDNFKLQVFEEIEIYK